MQRALCVYVKAELYMRKNYRPYTLRSFIRKDVIFEITYVTQHESCVCLSCLWFWVIIYIRLFEEKWCIVSFIPALQTLII